MSDLLHSSDMMSGSVLVCGGKDTDGLGRDDCVEYRPEENSWREHSSMTEPREEAAGVVLGSVMFVMGGFVGGEITLSTEFWNSNEDSPSWVTAPSLPEVRARFCAAARDVDGRNDRYFAIIGGRGSF